MNAEEIKKLVELNSKGFITDEALAYALNTAAASAIQAQEIDEDILNNDLYKSDEARLLAQQSRQRTRELKDRIAQRDAERLEQEKQRREEEELDNKIDYLSSLRNNNGELIYSNLKEDKAAIDNMKDYYEFVEEVNNTYDKYKEIEENKKEESERQKVAEVHTAEDKSLVDDEEKSAEKHEDELADLEESIKETVDDQKDGNKELADLEGSIKAAVDDQKDENKELADLEGSIKETVEDQKDDNKELDDLEASLKEQVDSQDDDDLKIVKDIEEDDIEVTKNIESETEVVPDETPEDPSYEMDIEKDLGEIVGESENKPAPEEFEVTDLTGSSVDKGRQKVVSIVNKAKTFMTKQNVTKAVTAIGYLTIGSAIVGVAPALVLGGVGMAAYGATKFVLNNLNKGMQAAKSR